MSADECEQILISAMALADGETPLLSGEETARHLSICERCRSEIAGQQEIINLFQAHAERETEAVDLWRRIEQRIEPKQTSKASANRYFFVWLGAVLIIYKLIEMIPARDFGFLFKVVPVVIIAILFYLFKENPFKINTELKLEG